ncbi:MAG: hypothetical protein Q7R48_03165 [bacterium]|nr:hypothetical protein [bacterium]
MKTQPGFKKALAVFKEAATEVPAYKAMLRKYKVNPRSIRTLKDFQKLPCMDKKGYIYKYPLEDLFPGRRIPAMAYASSGSSGKPTFWFRGDEQEHAGGDLHERIFKDVFGIKKDETTLVIVCFAMGVWVAGNYTLAACRSVARKGYRITTITPGIEREDIMNCLQNLAPRFKNVVIAGYPPFLMDIFQEVTRRGMNIPAKIKVLAAGDSFSEEWREDVAKLLNIKKESMCNVYGSADAGILGFETPLSISLRQRANKNPELSKELFGAQPRLPGFFQYDPDSVFFEERKGELLLTAATACPLIRYNIHDIGKVFSSEDIAHIAATYHLKEKRTGFPMVAICGRTDVAVTFYALNIYPEHIRAALEDKRVAKFLSGNFFAYNKTGRGSKTQALHMFLELVPGVQPSLARAALARTVIVEKLMTLNTEFRKLHSIIGNKALPLVILKEYGNVLPKKVRGLMSMKGKKPKMSS